MITFQDVTKSYGQQTVFAQASFHVSPGERIGVVGPNAAGKTTLFRLIMGLESPDKGQVFRAKNLSIGHLPQDVSEVGEEALVELVMAQAADLKTIEAELAEIETALTQASDPAELEALTRRQSHLLERYQHSGGYTLRSRAEKILEGLGFKAEEFDRPVCQFSGGWRMRALLARILLADPDLILLDEPTNHLDLNSMIWLEDYLSSLSATLMVISHDRVFLNRTVSRIIALENGRLGLYAGNYDAFQAEKEKQKAHQLAAYRLQQEKIRQIRLFIDRNRSRKDRARQVQSRLKDLEKMEKLAPPEAVEEISFSFPEPSRPPALLVGLEGVHFGYDPARPIYRDLSLEVRRGDRIALVGPNGAGKSSLLKLLAGWVRPSQGRWIVPAGVRLAYFAQHQLDQLNPQLTVMEELLQVSGQASQTQLRSLLGGFLFRGDDVFKKVSVLSGGEKSRLALAKLLFSAANLLILDEPTNHLDIPSRLALEQALIAWPGAICLVTHDRRLINAVANQIWEVSPGGRVEVFPGNLDDYLTTWQGLKASQPAKAVLAKPRKDKLRRRQEAVRRQRLAAATRELKDRLLELEGQVAEAEARLEALSAALANPRTYQDPEQARSLSLELGQAKARLSSLNEAWSEAALALEEAQKSLLAGEDG